MSLAQEGPVSPVVQPKDRDMRELVKKSVLLPDTWWEELADVAEATETDIGHLIVQLERHSLELSEPVPLPEDPELLGDKTQRSVGLRQERWDAIDKEATKRGYSRNKLFQAHLRRGLDAHYMEAGRPPKPRK